MTTIDQEQFVNLLHLAIKETLKKAQDEICEPLPEGLCFEIANLKQQERSVSFDDVVRFLYREGTFPVIVDVAVHGIKAKCTRIWIRASNHEFVTSFDQTWNTPPGRSPFKSVGLMAPGGMRKHHKLFSLADLKNF